MTVTNKKVKKKTSSTNSTSNKKEITKKPKSTTSKTDSATANDSKAPNYKTKTVTSNNVRTPANNVNTTTTNNTQTLSANQSEVKNTDQTTTSPSTSEQNLNTSSQTTQESDQTRIFFSEGQTLDMGVMDTMNLGLNLISNKYKKSDVTYTSSNNAVAIVDASGTITGKKQGSTDIIASIGSHSTTATVNVHDVTINMPELPYKMNTYYTYNYKTIAQSLEISEITVKSKSYSAYSIFNNTNGCINETIDVKGKITYVDKNITTFGSDDLYLGIFDENDKTENVFSDSNYVSLFGKAVGSTFECTINASLIPDKTYYIKPLTSSDYYYLSNKSDVDNTTLSTNFSGELTSYTDCTVNIGMYFHFVSTYYKRSDLTYTSSDESIATIDSYGNMTGKSLGKVDITVSVGSHKIVLHYVVHGWHAEMPKTPLKVNITGYKNPEPPATSSTSIDNTLTITNISFKHDFCDDKTITKRMFIKGTLDKETSKSDYYRIPIQIYDDSNHLLNSYKAEVYPIDDEGKNFKGAICLTFTQDKNYRITFENSSNSY